MYSAGMSPWPRKEPQEKETVPFDEDLSLSRPHRDEGCLSVSRSSRDFEDMDVFPPEGGRPSMEQTAAQAASEAIPEAGDVSRSPGRSRERPWQSLERQRMLRQSRRTTATGWMRIMTGTGTSRIRGGEGTTEKLESLAELDTEPYAVTEDYWVACIGPAAL